MAALRSRICFVLLSLTFLGPLLSVRSQGQASPAGWSRHTDPAGFIVDTPAGWNVSTDRQNGRISISGTQGERVTIWPMFVRDKQLDRSGAGTVLTQMARKINSGLPWGSPELGGSMARVVARTNQRNGVTLLAWNAASSGTALYVYGMEAAPNVYRNSADTFTNILTSFHPQSQGGQAQSPVKQGGNTNYSYVRWMDPRENAFTANVPQGWQTIGGLYRLSATDARTALQLVSPDHQIWVMLNDANVGSFIVPNQMLAQTGFREGSPYQLGDGSKLIVRRYIQGQQFAQEYVNSTMRRQCTDVRLAAGNNRQDLASAYMQELMADAAQSGYQNMRPQVTAGDVSFTCTVHDKSSGASTPMSGYISAGTVYVASGQSQLWYVHRLYGYLAPTARQREAEAVMQQVSHSFKMEAQWRARQRQISAEAVRQDNARSQQIRARAMAAIQEDQRKTSEIITSGYWKRQQTYDEISRKRENAILGTVDVVDPNSGKQYKVDNYSNYHWMSDTGYIGGTKTDNAPGPGWNKMIALP